MRSLWTVGYSIIFSSLALANGGQAPSGVPPATIASLQLKIERRNTERLVYGPGHTAALGQGDIDMLMAG